MTVSSIGELTNLAVRALVRAGACAASAEAAARMLVAADAQGLSSHGVARLSQYCTFLRNGRTHAAAVPEIVKSRGATCLIDADHGMAYEACALAVKTAINRANAFGIGCVGVTNSNHFGAAGLHLEVVGLAHRVGLAFSNSPAAMPPWNGKTALFGTNPIAAIFPRKNGDALLIDLALSEVARGKIMQAAKDDTPIPLGWAIDRDGKPTTNAKAALLGSMLPAGGAKGAMLALVVEILVCALTGAAFGFEADSFFLDEGNRPQLGQMFVVINPDAMAGDDVYGDRLETLVAAMLRDPGVRLPGARRRALAIKAESDGIDVPEVLYRQITQLADGAAHSY